MYESIQYMMKRVLSLGIALIMVFSSVSMVIAVQPEEQQSPNTLKIDRLGEILSRGTLVVALNPDDEPLVRDGNVSDRDSGSKCTDLQYTRDQVSGFYVDVASGIARDLGVDSCFVIPEPDELDRGNWSEKWDLYPNYYITSERLNRLYFTQPIVSVPYVFYIRNNDRNITRLEDLSGKTIGATYAQPVLAGYLNNSLSLPGNIPVNQVNNATIAEYDDESSAFGDLASGKLDALLLVESQGSAKIDDGVPISPLMPYAFIGYGGPSVEKGTGIDQVSFVRRMNDIIQTMHMNGELTRISMNYTGMDITRDAGTFNLTSLNQFNESTT